MVVRWSGRGGVVWRAGWDVLYRNIVSAFESGSGLGVLCVECCGAWVLCWMGSNLMAESMVQEC